MSIIKQNYLEINKVPDCLLTTFWQQSYIIDPDTNISNTKSND